MPKPKSLIKARLEQWHLKRMPFPATPFVIPSSVDPVQNGSVFARILREDELNRMRDDLLSAGFPDVIKRWRWIWARRRTGTNVGMGKTAFLVYIADQINRDYGKTFFGHAAHWLATYVLIPPRTRSVDDVMALALEAICGEARGTSVERLVLARLRHKVIALKRYGQHTLNLSAVVYKSFARDHWLQEHGIDLAALAAAVECYLCDEGVNADFAKALASGALRQFFARVNGDPNLIPAKPHLAGKASSLLLNDFARATQVAGISHMTFLLDDFYHLVRRTSPADRPDLAAHLRSIAVDGAYFSSSQNLFNWVAVMHTHTAATFSEAWRHRDMHLIDTLQHSDGGIFALNSLNLDQGPALLETFLNYQRPKNGPDKSYPFTHEALGAITYHASEVGKAGSDSYEPRGLLRDAF